jgi:hypothetical protein
MGKTQDMDHCKACGSEELFDAWFDKAGYANDGDPGSKYRTVCQVCGQFQDQRVQKGKAS